ncbi:hypothetical protein MSAR_42480 [Mycolicibacterium sarraceniae]|uniref:Uncharacterized protein n=1 Tax=Mycolicibacterium sarraceniae TaxID=1534348 RepID=A0A7I7SVS2_9MYCO|nr:hypothetical protein MSAR_42480 [Mycolicibacterium sarraceniae]
MAANGGRDLPVALAEDVIAVGGGFLVVYLPGLADIDYLINVGILELDTLPDHLVIIGGS